MSDDHVRTAQRADSERHPLRVITNAHDGVDVLPNCATLVERAVDVVDGDSAGEAVEGKAEKEEERDRVVGAGFFLQLHILPVLKDRQDGWTGRLWCWREAVLPY